MPRPSSIFGRYSVCFNVTVNFCSVKKKDKLWLLRTMNIHAFQRIGIFDRVCTKTGLISLMPVQTICVHYYLDFEFLILQFNKRHCTTFIFWKISFLLYMFSLKGFAGKASVVALSYKSKGHQCQYSFVFTCVNSGQGHFNVLAEW